MIIHLCFSVGVSFKVELKLLTTYCNNSRALAHDHNGGSQELRGEAGVVGTQQQLQELITAEEGFLGEPLHQGPQ
jgi:hypothetical protein